MPDYAHLVIKDSSVTGTTPLDEGRTITSTIAAGKWQITPALCWEWEDPPNWRTRKAAEWLLGWKWISYLK